MYQTVGNYPLEFACVILREYVINPDYALLQSVGNYIVGAFTWKIWELGRDGRRNGHGEESFRQ